MRISRTLFAAILAFVAAGCSSVPAAAPTPAATSGLIAPGIDLIRGTFVPGTQPDGNSVILTGRHGLVVVDTGRHESHTQKVLDYAKAAGLPIVAVVNTHWHLDHVGGNLMIRNAYPAVRVYASGAIEDAMHGFLAKYRSDLESMLATTKDPAAQKSFRSEVAIIDSGRALFPDVTITSSGRRKIGGRAFDVHLEKDTVTAGDVWLVDRATSTVIAGDLVTLPAPFLDTACPARWSAALGRLDTMTFAQLVPGHGPALTRSQFTTYRTAFDALLDCANSTAAKERCADGWIRDASSLLKNENEEFTRSLIGYYVENVLRDRAHIAKLCEGSRSPAP